MQAPESRLFFEQSGKASEVDSQSHVEDPRLTAGLVIALRPTERLHASIDLETGDDSRCMAERTACGA